VTLQVDTLDPDVAAWSAPDGERDNRPLLVLMHGWSYDESHLFQYRDSFGTDLVVASVRAPHPEAGGYAWFPSRGNPIGDPQPHVANMAVGAVLDWLDGLHIQPTSIGLLGFSQGGAMVLQLMRTRPEMFAYGVHLAGFVVDDEQPGDAALARRRPPILWGRGREDRVIPRGALERTETWMSHHCRGTTRIYDHLGHDVVGKEIEDFAAFVDEQSQ
jgi:phospholipase/carboxylesterase